MFNKVVLFIGLIAIQSLFFASVAQENNQSQWPMFNEWYRWKTQTNLSEKQKAVTGYLKNASMIFNKVSTTRSVQSGSIYGDPNPEKAIKVIRQAIKEFKRLPYPKECKKYRSLTIEIMKGTIAYHKLRVNYKEGTEKFDRAYRKLQLSESEKNLDGMQFDEYFKSMKNVGLFDNIEEEMQNLESNNPPPFPPIRKSK